VVLGSRKSDTHCSIKSYCFANLSNVCRDAEHSHSSPLSGTLAGSFHKPLPAHSSCISLYAFLDPTIAQVQSLVLPAASSHRMTPVNPKPPSPGHKRRHCLLRILNVSLAIAHSTPLPLFLSTGSLCIFVRIKGKYRIHILIFHSSALANTDLFPAAASTVAADGLFRYILVEHLHSLPSPVGLHSRHLN